MCTFLLVLLVRTLGLDSNILAQAETTLLNSTPAHHICNLEISELHAHNPLSQPRNESTFASLVFWEIEDDSVEERVSISTQHESEKTFTQRMSVSENIWNTIFGSISTKYQIARAYVHLNILFQVYLI